MVEPWSRALKSSEKNACGLLEREIPRSPDLVPLIFAYFVLFLRFPFLLSENLAQAMQNYMFEWSENLSLYRKRFVSGQGPYVNDHSKKNMYTIQTITVSRFYRLNLIV